MSKRRRRDRKVDVTLFDAEFEAIRSAADARGLSVAAYIRSAALQGSLDDEMTRLFGDDNVHPVT